MTQNNNESQFPVTAPAADPVFYRTYSRRTDKDVREQWEDTVCRTIPALAKLGKFTPEEESLARQTALEHKVFPSGRWLWVGGTKWIEQPENFSGAYNCTSTDVVDWDSFGFLMNLAMMGTGTGAVLEHHYIDKLPPIRNRLNVCLTGTIGSTPIEQRQDETEVIVDGSQVTLHVGDSRIGWVKSYQALLELSSDERFEGEVTVNVDLSDVRPAGEKLKGFGGVANPIRLPDLYGRCANILNKAVGRKLTPLECCLLIDEAAVVVVAGNIRRSAGIRQFSSKDELAATAKENLWMRDEEGNWRIDPERDALRMANHTRVFHNKPTLDECLAAVRKQYYSGEGAIQWAGEAKKRAQGYDRYGLNPCAEIIGEDFHCNLSEVHLNQIDPNDHQDQDDAFRAGAIAVAALLNHQFIEPRYQKSREEDPIVGVSFTGLFDFFVHAFGADWLNWWEDGRPDTVTGIRFKQQEKEYLNRWRDVVHQAVWNYCDRHALKRPNRCTTVQPAGTKSLLTGASSGWHPPKAQRFIRRITFGKNDPVALACLDYGYSIVPSQSDKDENGRLLDDPYDPRCTEWLVEIPTEVPWANLPGADTVDISQFSALAQFDFYMQVQKYYTTHNTSATIELREPEVEALGHRIFEAIRDDEGYISSALLARFDDHETFPRLPFEPISKAKYEQLRSEVLKRRTVTTFAEAMSKHDQPDGAEAGPAGCDGDKCLFSAK